MPRFRISFWPTEKPWTVLLPRNIYRSQANRSHCRLKALYPFRTTMLWQPTCYSRESRRRIQDDGPSTSERLDNQPSIFTRKSYSLQISIPTCRCRALFPDIIGKSVKGMVPNDPYGLFPANRTWYCHCTHGAFSIIHKPKRGEKRRFHRNHPPARGVCLSLGWGFQDPIRRTGDRIPKTALRGKAVFADIVQQAACPLGT